MYSTIFADRRRPCSRCGEPHPDRRGHLQTDDPVKQEALLDGWYESEILFGAPVCWDCCTQAEQRLIVIGLLSDAA